MVPLDLAELLYRALEAQYGVVVTTPDPNRLRQKLYPIRKAQPDFECLAFIISPINNQDLWIIKQGAPDA